MEPLKSQIEMGKAKLQLLYFELLQKPALLIAKSLLLFFVTGPFVTHERSHLYNQMVS